MKRIYKEYWPPFWTGCNLFLSVRFSVVFIGFSISKGQTATGSVRFFSVQSGLVSVYFRFIEPNLQTLLFKVCSQWTLEGLHFNEGDGHVCIEVWAQKSNHPRWNIWCLQHPSPTLHHNGCQWEMAGCTPGHAPLFCSNRKLSNSCRL